MDGNQHDAITGIALNPGTFTWMVQSELKDLTNGNTKKCKIREIYFLNCKLYEYIKIYRYNNNAKERCLISQEIYDRYASTWQYAGEGR